MPPKLLEVEPVYSETANGQPTFKMFTSALKAYEKANDRKYLSCTASSSVMDLHGDTMTAECVQDMAPQAKQKSMTIFLNHSYAVPEDVFGYVTEAKIISRAADDNGAIYDLDLEIELNEANPRAVETYNVIKDQNVKLGVSIGAMIDDFEFKDKEAGWWGGLTIKRVNLLEASIVGIPANPRSWVQNAVRSIKAWDASNPTKLISSEVPEDPKDVKPDLTDESCPDCGAAMGPGHKCEASTNPETTAEGATEVPAADVSAAADATAEEPTSPVDLAASLQEVADGSAELTSGLVTTMIEALAAADDRITTLEAQLAEAEANFQTAAAIVERIATTPLGRKTAFEAPVSDFRRKFAGIYGEGLLKVLDD